MYISTRRLYWEYYICMNACMYVCIMYVCMFVLQSARHSARRSLIGALIGALCAVDVSLVKYAVENMYISTRRLYWEYYICMNACMYVCIMYVLCTPIGAIGSDR